VDSAVAVDVVTVVDAEIVAVVTVVVEIVAVEIAVVVDVEVVEVVEEMMTRLGFQLPSSAAL
jgi:hypothetical protein